MSVAAGVTTDPAGNPNTAASYTWEYRPKSPSYNIVSDVANGVSGAGLAVALATPVVLGTTMVGEPRSRIQKPCETSPHMQSAHPSEEAIVLRTPHSPSGTPPPTTFEIIQHDYHSNSSCCVL